LLVGLANDGFGQQNASMGVDCGDLNNDGLLDFFMTDYQTELPIFYRNLGNGRFEDATHETQAGISVFPYVNWGNGIVDFDNDGDRDIYIANGHTEDNVDLYDSSTAYRVRDTVLMNTGKGHFRDVSATCGDGLDPVRASRGTGFDDLDNDGDVDGVVQISREKPVILRNENRNGNHWLQIQLRGTSVNRDAVGSKVTVVAGDLTLIDEVHSGRGYQSHHGMRLSFGLGQRNSVDRVEIRWLGGTTEVLRDVKVDQLLTIIEGRAGERTPGN
jgi:hypothetical protein